MERCKYCGREMDLPLTVGSRIRWYRNQAQMTQAALADRVDVSRVTISQLERGHADPRVELLARIGHALGVEFSRLMPDVPPPDAATLERRQQLLEELGVGPDDGC
jgi:putative transcriptional regulator